MTAPQEIRPASKAPIIDYETRLTDVTCVACKRDFKVHVPFPLTREQWHDAYLARIRQLEAEVENWRNREALVCPEDFGFEEVIAALHVTIEGLKRSTRRRRDEIIEVQDERNALRAELASAREEIATATAAAGRIDSERAENAKLRARVAELEAEVDRLKAHNRTGFRLLQDKCRIINERQYCRDPRCNMGPHHHAVERKEHPPDGVSYSGLIHLGSEVGCVECAALKPEPASR